MTVINNSTFLKDYKVKKLAATAEKSKLATELESNIEQLTNGIRNIW